MSESAIKNISDIGPSRSEFANQIEELCEIHDHITRVISNVELKLEWFSDYDDPDRANFRLIPVVRTLLYKQALSLSQSEVARRLRGSAYIFLRFGLNSPMNQQIISHNWRNRFTPKERQLIKDLGDLIREICVKSDVIQDYAPSVEPEQILGTGFDENQIREAVELATTLGFSDYTANRATNKKYALEAYFERQGYLNFNKVGVTSERRRFARLSNRIEVPHGSSHYRTLLKIATPNDQSTFDEFTGGKRKPEWMRIRDTILPAFHAGVENILEEIEQRDRTGFREPVHAALDITTWNYWSSPFKPEEKIEPTDEPNIVKKNGEIKKVYPKEEYPEMVSGLKEKYERGYKFATLTIVAQDTPIVLAIEPVRDKRWWELGEPITTSRDEIVERLLDQASQHVDIHKIFADSEFSSYAARDVIDQRGIQYVIPKKQMSEEDEESIVEVMEDELTNVRIEWGYSKYNHRKHKVTFIFEPTDKSEDEYSIFLTNEWVDYHRGTALTGQYSQRWEIENQYKTIKAHFLPSAASGDYRIRLLYFTIAVTLYNTWRLTNFALRDDVDVDLGDSPPIPAGEIIELIAFVLFDPGG